MEKILTFGVFIAILLLIPKIQSQSNDDDTPPLCLTQFALVNNACAFLHTRDDDDDDDSSPPSPPNDNNDDGGDAPGRMDNGDGQSLVDADDGDDHHRHHHHHHHRRRNRQGRGDSDREEDCCRWLKEVDDDCVCALLLRLPPFLNKLDHEYTVVVNDDCDVTYECEGLNGD